MLSKTLEAKILEFHKVGFALGFLLKRPKKPESFNFIKLIFPFQGNFFLKRPKKPESFQFIEFVFHFQRFFLKRTKKPESLNWDRMSGKEKERKIGKEKGERRNDKERKRGDRKSTRLNSSH